MKPKNQNISKTKKILYIIYSIIAIILAFIIGGNLFGLLGGILATFLAAAYVSKQLSKNHIISSNSAWVKETKGVKIAKYILLALILLAILGVLAYFIFNN